MTTLSSATFTNSTSNNMNLTIDNAGHVYRFVRSYPNGVCEADLIGDLTSITDAEYAALDDDDRARCTVAR